MPTLVLPDSVLKMEIGSKRDSKLPLPYADSKVAACCPISTSMTLHRILDVP